MEETDAVEIISRAIVGLIDGDVGQNLDYWPDEYSELEQATVRDAARLALLGLVNAGVVVPSPNRKGKE